MDPQVSAVFSRHLEVRPLAGQPPFFAGFVGEARDDNRCLIRKAGVGSKRRGARTKITREAKLYVDEYCEKAASVFGGD